MFLISCVKAYSKNCYDYFLFKLGNILGDDQFCSQWSDNTHISILTESTIYKPTV